MKKLIFFKTISAVILLFFIALQANSQIKATDEDPDLPKINQSINKEDYLKARSEYDALKRGVPYNLPYNPRLKAIEEKRLQEIQQRRNPNNVALSPNWIAEGPAPIPNGPTSVLVAPVSGRVTAIAVHPTNSSIVYVGTANGGVYRSMDGGDNWTAIFDDAQSLSIGSLALAPSSPSTLYVGTGEGNLAYDCYFGVGLYRIDNADVSPSLVGPINPTGIFSYRSISKILVSDLDPAVIFVSTTFGYGGSVSVDPGNKPMGLFRSTNATDAVGSVGFTKLQVTSLNGGNNIISDMVMSPGAPTNIICAVMGAISGQGGIYRTTNALDPVPIFTNVYPLNQTNNRVSLAICRIRAKDFVYAGIANNTPHIIKSVDDGMSWASVAGDYNFCDNQCTYDMSLALSPTDPKRLYVGGSAGNNIFQYSSDGGSTFIISNINLHADVHAIAIAPSATNIIYLGSDGGIFKSTTGGISWASKNTAGFSATQFESIALHPIDTKFSIGGTQDNGTIMYKPDGTFYRVDYGDGGYAVIDQNATNTSNVSMYHTYYNGGSFLGMARVDLVANASDGNWVFYGCSGNVSANGINCGDPVMFYAPLVAGPGNPNTIYYCTDRLYRSTDKGVNFTVVSQAPIISSIPISSAAISPLDDNFRILGLKNGKVFGTASGSSILKDITPAGASSNPVGRVFFDPLHKSTVYICYSGFGLAPGNHIWKATNFSRVIQGAIPSWVASGNGIPDVPINSFAIDPVNTEILYAGTDIGVYCSIDGGANWSSFSDGLPIVSVFDMAVHPISRNLRIATHGRGLYSTTSAVLPITLSSFIAAARANGKVYLEWITQSEQNNKGFEVQRTLSDINNNFNWVKIGFVNGSVNSASPKRYYFDDEPIGGEKFLYRLKQIDIDGKYTLSANRLVTLKGVDYGLYASFPNPATDLVHIKYKIPQHSQVKMKLFDNSGRLLQVLFDKNEAAGIYDYSFAIKSLAAGIYFYRMEAGDFFDTKSFTVTK